MKWQDIEGWWSTKDNELNTELAQRLDTGVIVSLGVHKGRSMVAMAEAFRAAGKLEAMQFVGIDIFPANTFTAAANYLGGYSNVSLVKGDAIGTANLVASGSVAAVFVDAGHTAGTTAAIIAAWQPKLRDGGIMCGHDYQPHWPGVVQAVDEAYPDGVSVFHTAWAAFAAEENLAPSE